MFFYQTRQLIMNTTSSDSKKTSGVSGNYWMVNLICLWFSQILVMAGFSALIPFIPLFITQQLGITDKVQVATAVSLFGFFGSFFFFLTFR